MDLLQRRQVDGLRAVLHFRLSRNRPSPFGEATQDQEVASYVRQQFDVDLASLLVEPAIVRDFAFVLTVCFATSHVITGPTTPTIPVVISPTSARWSPLSARITRRKSGSRGRGASPAPA